MKKSILALAALAIFAFAEEPEIPTVEQLFNVRTVAVETGEVAPSRIYYGTVAVDESSLRQVTLRFDGFIESLAAKETYRTVEPGELLMEVYGPEVVSAQSEYIQALRYGGNDGKLAASAREKLLRYGLAEKTVNAIAKRKEPMTAVPVYASAAGTVMERMATEGGFAKRGQVLFTLADLSTLWVHLKIYQEEAGFVRPGMKALLRFKGVEGTFRGTVETLYPRVDEKERTVTARVVLDNKEGRILPGMLAEGVLAGTGKSALVLPESAVITKGETHIVFKAGEWEGEYEPMKIAARRLPDGRFQVLSGLAEGDRVVDKALFLMDADAQINGLYQ